MKAQKWLLNIAENSVVAKIVCLERSVRIAGNAILMLLIYEMYFLTLRPKRRTVVIYERRNMISEKIYICEICGRQSTSEKEILSCEEDHKTEASVFRALKFEMTEQHIKLLRHMHVGWQKCEYGAPEINPKRPYGNSWVEGDIAKILGIEPDGSTDWDGEKIHSLQQVKAMYVLHLETQLALQIVLRTGKFETGKYVRKGSWDDWKKEEAMPERE